MAIPSGTRLGPYEIIAAIGAGGMGEVYRSRDTRLDRVVAIKVLPAHVADDAQLRERFEREARTIATLNHPHICVLYDVGQQDGIDFLVMEYLEGETLAARLMKGSLPVEQVLQYGSQIAGALAAAHAREITHRDLKPGNIMVGKTGVKVLDFGLAKFHPNVDETLTAGNQMMGTPAYMAPEQFEGRECDSRTDIYALGLVLYEMTAGKRAPRGPLPPLLHLPEKLAHVIERCLARDPEDRWQTAKDVKSELEWAVKSITVPPVSVPVPKARPRWIWGAAALVGAGLIAAGVAFFRPVGNAIERPSQFTVSFEEQMAGAPPNQFTWPRPSPDGRFLAFVGSLEQERASLWIRPLNSAQVQRLAGTEGTEMAFWSPDSRWIGFYADGKLKKIGAEGGPVQTIAELPEVQEAAWGSAGDIIYRPSNRMPLFRISDTGGQPTPLTHLDSSRTENSHRFISFLPDGRRFLFTARCAERENNALYLGSLDSPKLKRLMSVQSGAWYVPSRDGGPDALLYYSDGGIVARRFDLSTEEVSGAPVPVVGDVAYTAASILASFAISSDGRVAVVRPSSSAGNQFIWFDRNGNDMGTLGPLGASQPRISPDGARVAFTAPDPKTGNRDVFSIEIARSIVSRLTLDVANDWYPVWSPDGKQLLFGSDRAGGTATLPYIKSSMDPGSNELALPSTIGDPYDWSPDGRWISSGLSDIWMVSASGTDKPFAFLKTQFQEGAARFSPDGKWLAYTSNESGRFEVYVRPFHGEPASAEGKIQISQNGGDFPAWRPGGGELYYMSDDRIIYAVNTKDLGRTSVAPLPARLFPACPGKGLASPPGTGVSYDYAFDTHDGQRFLVNCTVEPPGRFLVLMNWPLESKR